MRCERIALPTEPYPHGRFTNSIIINTQKKCKHNYINRFTNFNCYGKIFFTWRHGSAGRAFASHARGHRFESCCLHQHYKSPSFTMGFYNVGEQLTGANPKTCFRRSAVACNRLRYAVRISSQTLGVAALSIFVIHYAEQPLLSLVCFDNRLELGRFYRPRAKLHGCDQGHTARD